MANNNNPTPVPNSLRNYSKEFPYVAESTDIYDPKLEKNQEEINNDVKNAIGNEEDPDSILGRIKEVEDSVGQAGGLATLNEDGKVPDEQLRLVCDKITDESIGMTQAEINAIVLNDVVTVSLAATPSPVFVRQESAISLMATISTPADNIKIMQGSTEIATGSGTSLSGTYNITPNEAGNIPFTADFTVGELIKSASRNVAAVYPVMYGAGDTYTDAVIQASAKMTPAGTYNIDIQENGKYVFFVVPRTMNITSAKMGGFDFPLQNPVNVSIEGVEYKYYQSSNTYDAGTLTIVIS